MASKLYIQSDTYIKPRTNENTGYIAQAVNIEGINPDTNTTQSIQAILNHLYSLIGGSTPVVQYTVTFNTDGGSGSVAAITGNAGTQITLPTYSGTKSGYTNAQKWIINGTEYNQGATYTLNANVTAKAKWTQNAAQYTITFDTDGGSSSVAAITRNAGTQITLPTYSGTKSGYTNAQKWIINGTEYNQGATYTLNANVTAKAKWTQNAAQYTITFDTDGGSSSVAAITRDAGTQITLPTYSGTKSGYTNAQKWIINGTEYNQGATYTLNANVTAKAKWTIKTYTVTLTVNGGSGSGSNSKTVDHGSTVTFTGVSPDSEHTDVGATVSGGGATISGTTVTLVNVTSNTDITVTFPEIQQTYYWYVGQEKPTLDNYTSLATQVNMYTSPYEYTNTSGTRGYTYILIHNSKSIESVIGKTTGGKVTINIDDTINIDNYNVYKTVGATTNNATIIITIS